MSIPLKLRIYSKGCFIVLCILTFCFYNTSLVNFVFPYRRQCGHVFLCHEAEGVKVGGFYLRPGAFVKYDFRISVALKGFTTSRH